MVDRRQCRIWQPYGWLSGGRCCQCRIWQPYCWLSGGGRLWPVQQAAVPRGRLRGGDRWHSREDGCPDGGTKVVKLGFEIIFLRISYM